MIFLNIIYFLLAVILFIYGIYLFAFPFLLIGKLTSINNKLQFFIDQKYEFEDDKEDDP